jgi:hypothetical protein
MLMLTTFSWEYRIAAPSLDINQLDIQALQLHVYLSKYAYIFEKFIEAFAMKISV